MDQWQICHKNQGEVRLSTAHAIFIDEALASDDELTAYKLKMMLIQKWPELHSVSLSTIKRCRQQLGWISTTPRYCQLNREVNKAELQDDEHFENVIFSDESTVILEKHGKVT